MAQQHSVSMPLPFAAPLSAASDRSKQLSELPNEIIDAIIAYLPPPSLFQLALVSSWAYDAAIPRLWRRVDLVDQRTRHNAKEEIIGEQWEYSDEHDDTPLIKILTVLASKPFIASKVHTLTHRCHLPCPGIFNELTHNTFQSRTLSADPRTLYLLQKAVDNLTNVQNLRIVFGHWNLTLGLLKGFLNARSSRIKRLWLENVSLDGLEDLATKFQDLVSLRIRRVHLYDFSRETKRIFTLARGGALLPVSDGRAGTILTTAVQRPQEELERITDRNMPCPMEVAPVYDRRIYALLPHTQAFLASQGFRYEPVNMYRPIEYVRRAPDLLVQDLVSKHQSTLTSINLDWILLPNSEIQPRISFLPELCKLRFPHLKAFQLRNAVTDHTRLPARVYLLEPSVHSLEPDGSYDIDFLSFMEYHDKLQCLAWPMSRFYAQHASTTSIAHRSAVVVQNLSRTLVDLRVDEDYARDREPLTIGATVSPSWPSGTRRRRFINDFARHLTHVTSLKMEGGIPRDERRETMRALRNSPLERLVFIGVSCPIGNTWGADGMLLTAIDEGEHGVPGLEPEYTEFIVEHTAAFDPTQSYKLMEDKTEPEYGWPPQLSMLWQIAYYHASTIRELKFCGYNGSPVLYSPLVHTDAFLQPLRYFDRLEQLVLSMWMLTFHNQEYMDQSIIQYWSECESPHATALALLPSASEPDSASSWSARLVDIYAPEALARQVARQIGPHLSEVAKKRRGGVNVRTSFCLGVRSADIFDLDVRIGEGNKVLEFRRPMAEQEEGRRAEKLDARRWF